MNRRKIHDRFQSVRERGEFLVGAAVGSGLFAEAAEKGGADFIFALGAGRLRLMGAASVACLLPIRESNEFVASFGATEFVDRCSIPVFFGASVMTQRSTADIVACIAGLGFAGVTNYPSVAHYPAPVSKVLESNGLGFRKELELLSAARAMDLWTVCWVRSREQAQEAAAAGMDMVCFDYGWTTGGWHGMGSALTLKEAAMVSREVATAVRRENERTFVVVVGGPIEKIEDLLPIYRTAHISGYVGGSTIDRLPLEEAVMNQTLRFKATAAMTLKHNEHHRSLVAFGRSLGLVGASQRMLELYRTIRQASLSPPRFASAISGEQGTGRQFVAEALFRLGGGKPEQLTTIDASEMSAQRLMIALFGRHARNKNDRAIRGAAGSAETTGLIIRGLEQVSAHTQQRIARFLAKGTFRAVGSKRDETSALRILFISGRDVRSLAKEGTLHPDLYRELKPREIAVPALREYVEDIEEIVSDMAMRLADAPQQAPRLSPAALRRLQIHDWPGNLTELRTFVMRLATSNSTERVDDATLAQLLATESAQSVRPASERDVILDALWRHGFHRGRTARFLGICRRTLFNRIRHYRLRG